MQAALKVIRYLKNSPGMGLFYAADNILKISGFSVIGRLAKNPESLSQGFVYFLDLLSYPGNPKSNVLHLDLHLNQSIELLPR